MTARSRSGSPPSARMVAALLVTGALAAGCAGKAETTASLAPVDVRERHPIVLKDAPRSLDVFVGRSGAALDRRQSEDVVDFAREYRRSGRGGMVAEVPTGDRRDLAARDTLGGIRAALARGGVSPGALSVRTYPVRDPGLASPIRLTFASLQATLPHECGQWPTDLGSSDFKFSASNEPYWNFGCATQATLATQVADPIDLVRSRNEGRPDIVKRMGAIAKIREGKDPSTEYRSSTPQINSTVGGGT
ncbi:CpaD family pilus assembly protein [Bosea sp. SSUT16]|uniref:CpaD family pilus assembly protein n=1 Tax=Bosea spartocytisi TaxID=2773451 RepID=A0A927E9K8_9HYPH|nr:CpaD family pilus assembly protein [Bosea spartocytisi]MBD3845371.1 CpaD family pilus assembly protein [Bosea spartocytisi]MCT4472541.1 CpaD family pilus assembly protein [Bosea spartocytisi]